MELQEVLPPEAASARLSRKLAAEALRMQQREDLVDEVTLLISELVTNAVLHAGSEIGLRVCVDDRLVRVEVSDGSPVIPASRNYDTDAATGRGLGMVQFLATRWGVEQRDDGKVVWFEIGGEPAPAGEAVVLPQPVLDEGIEIRLEGIPVRLYRALQQHNDALLREYALVAFADGTPAAVSTHLGFMAAIHVQLESRIPLTDPLADAAITVPVESHEQVASLLTTLNTADELARSGDLLTPPALPEISALRLWLFREIVRQLEDEPPQPWSPIAPADDPGLVALHAVEDHALLEQLSDGIVVADSANHITYVNPAAERLLGYAPGELRGRRLTTIIPKRLREAHVAGYTHYLLTREPRLIGRAVHVPARRRDGTEVAVELMLSAVRGAHGRQAFVGTLREASTAAERRAALTRTLEGMHHIVLDLLDTPPATVREAGKRVLVALGSSLAWQYGTLWEVDAEAGELVCAHTWDHPHDRYRRFADISREQRFRPGVGLPGRVWEASQALWIGDVVADANFPRLSAALQDGLRSALAVPLRDRGTVVGVLELFSTELQEVDNDLLAVAGTLGDLVVTLVAGDGSRSRGGDV